MGSLTCTTVFAFACGLAAYGLLRTYFWDVEIAAFAGIVGLCAAAGGALGNRLALWLSGRRAGRGR
jgi:hypothetical protein